MRPSFVSRAKSSSCPAKVISVPPTNSLCQGRGRPLCAHHGHACCLPAIARAHTRAALLHAQAGPAPGSLRRPGVAATGCSHRAGRTCRVTCHMLWLVPVSQPPRSQTLGALPSMQAKPEQIQAACDAHVAQAQATAQQARQELQELRSKMVHVVSKEKLTAALQRIQVRDLCGVTDADMQGGWPDHGADARRDSDCPNALRRERR